MALARAVPAIVLAALMLLPEPAAAQNPLARFAPAPETLVEGRWNGVDLERRSNCTNSQNNGSRGTYAQFDVATDAAGGFAITQSGITGLDCTYSGRYEAAGGRMAVRGTFSCSDGKQGDFETTSVHVNDISLDIQMAVRLTSSESCTIEKILGMSRLRP